MPNNENNENNENIMQGGAEMNSAAVAGIAVGAAYAIPIIVILSIAYYLKQLDYIEVIQKACIEVIRKDLKMQSRLCLTYKWQISKESGSGMFSTKPHKHKFSKIYIIDKKKEDFLFNKLNGLWNKGKPLKKMLKDTTIINMFPTSKKKKVLIEYMAFDYFFCSINDVIIDEILDDLLNELFPPKKKDGEPVKEELSPEKKKIKKMKDLNTKIEKETLKRISMRITSSIDKKFMKQMPNEAEVDEFIEKNGIKPKYIKKKIGASLNDFLRINKESYDKMATILKPKIAEYIKSQGVPFGADLAAKLLFNKAFESAAGNMVETIFSGGTFPNKVPPALYTVLEDQGIKIEEEEKNDIKRVFEIKYKICPQLSFLTEKIKKLDIKELMSQFGNELGESDELIYNSIFSTCDEKIKKPEKKDTISDICNQFAILKPFTFGLSTLINITHVNKMFKTSKTTTQTKNLICEDFYAAIVEDILVPLKEKVAEKFEEQSNKCKELLDEPDVPDDKKGGAVIGQGTFGCVFRPHIKCSKKKFKKEHVSKLVVDREWRIRREIKLSEKIKSIPNYQHFFAPIEEICDTNLSKITKEDKKGCKLLYKNNDKYVKKIANIRFIDGHDVIETLTKNGNQKDYFIYFLTMYEQLLDCVQLLNDKKIIHHDIKFNNIIYDKKQNRTILFDFGLSFDLENIIQLKRCFYIDWAPDWTLWPIEVHYLGFVINNRKKMSSEEINSFATEYLDEHRVFINLKNIVPNGLLQKYKKKTIKMLNFYNNKNLDIVVSYIINSYWETWNSYSLNIMFYRLLNVINMSGYSNNVFFQELVKIFNDNISPIPTERNTIEATKEKFKNVKKLLSPEIYNKFFKNIKINKINIMKTLKNDKSTWKKRF